MRRSCRRSQAPAAFTETVIVDTINAVRIEFDAAKDGANRDRHGVSLGEPHGSTGEGRLPSPIGAATMASLGRLATR